MIVPVREVVEHPAEDVELHGHHVGRHYPAGVVGGLTYTFSGGKIAIVPAWDVTEYQAEHGE